jgi:hypothetical protein
VEVRKGEKDGEEERKETKKEEGQEMRGIIKVRYNESCRRRKGKKRNTNVVEKEKYGEALTAVSC